MNKPKYAKTLVDSWITKENYYQCVELIERSGDFNEEQENLGVDEEFYLIWMLLAWVGLACRSGAQQFYESYGSHTGKISSLLRKYGLNDVADIFELGGFDPTDLAAMDQIDAWIYANEDIVHQFVFKYFDQNRGMIYKYANCGDD